MVARGLTTSDVASAIREQTSVTSGCWRAPWRKKHRYSCQLPAVGFKTAEEWQHCAHARQDTRTTLLKDVTRIELAAGKLCHAYLPDKSAALAIQEFPGAMLLKLAHG